MTIKDEYMQPSLWDTTSSSLSSALVGRSGDPDNSKHGVVYTRTWVVELILNLSGYVSEKNLVDAVVVEPSCGVGDFLEPIVQRLSDSCHRQERPLQDCFGSIRAFELDADAVSASRKRVETVLIDGGWPEAEVREMAQEWVRQSDFLLDPEPTPAWLGGGVDYVIGNPPYVRLEEIAREVADRYRRMYKTMTGRADIYIGLYEKALNLLDQNGVCGFICADRWMLNQYGGNLRKLITEQFAVEAVVEMHDASAFQEEVLAYPAITIIRRSKQGKSLVAKLGRTSDVAVPELLDELERIREGGREGERSTTIKPNRTIVDEWFSGSAPWPCVSPRRLRLLKHLEANFYPVEDPTTDTKVGIGVATGADKVFLTDDPNLVEENRLLPMALAKDTMTGVLEWSGHYLVNPWEPDGSLVDLERYPRLHRYLEKNETVLRNRNVGKRNASRWYRTIDKVNHALTARPKLLIPDIKSVAHPVYDEGTVYPHHNLYHITSEAWDLKVLGGILLSRVGQFFVECYAVRMQGGYLRFQAQYLRRIKVPRPEDIGPAQARTLSEAFEHRDVDAATRVALELYGLDYIPEEE